jgi:hypothetical protein
MSILETQIAATLGPGMAIPEPFSRLFDWIEQQGFGDSLFSRAEAAWTEKEREGGTDISFLAEGNAYMGQWLGNDDPQVLARICVFAKTGSDGSMAAFWLDDEGRQRIVHLGSGSGSCLTCVLADDPVDFLRLLAIGYDEICWSERFDVAPNEGLVEGEIFVHPNVPYRRWVEETFGVDIPRTASEIVKHAASMDDDDSPDPFCRWVETNRG